MQVSRAETVLQVMAMFTIRARLERRINSSCISAGLVSAGTSSLASSALARSTIRPRRFAKTLSNVQTPVMRKTGAMASWIMCAMVEIGFSGGMVSYLISSAGAQPKSADPLPEVEGAGKNIFTSDRLGSEGVFPRLSEVGKVLDPRSSEVEGSGAPESGEERCQKRP